MLEGKILVKYTYFRFRVDIVFKRASRKNNSFFSLWRNCATTNRATDRAQKSTRWNFHECFHGDKLGLGSLCADTYDTADVTHLLITSTKGRISTSIIELENWISFLNSAKG